nr:immunoglobulin heavy chain junction region [Macaca mulatta]MOX39226.1 immunoglobulin heavy chain junction region [Macaca mulatta]MOX41376.1 immunoglobulin heavy chain junction region [Macaca mulatta]
CARLVAKGAYKGAGRYLDSW